MVASCHSWVLGTSSLRGQCAANHRAISLTPCKVWNRFVFQPVSASGKCRVKFPRGSRKNTLCICLLPHSVSCWFWSWSPHFLFCIWCRRQSGKQKCMPLLALHRYLLWGLVIFEALVSPHCEACPNDLQSTKREFPRILSKQEVQVLFHLAVLFLEAVLPQTFLYQYTFHLVRLWTNGFISLTTTEMRISHNLHNINVGFQACRTMQTTM